VFVPPESVARTCTTSTTSSASGLWFVGALARLLDGMVADRCYSPTHSVTRLVARSCKWVRESTRVAWASACAYTTSCTASDASSARKATSSSALLLLPRRSAMSSERVE